MGAALTREHEAIRNQAERLAGGPGDIPQRVALLHGIFLDSGGNHVFPEVALHGALWAYSFYERRGAVSRAIAYRYFYDADERARRAYMLFRFSQGFKEANRSVFVDTYSNYVFAKRHGEAPGADEVLAPALLEALNRVHQARRAGTALFFRRLCYARLFAFRTSHVRHTSRSATSVTRMSGSRRLCEACNLPSVPAGLV